MVLVCAISAASTLSIAFAQTEDPVNQTIETKEDASEDLTAKLQGKWTVMRGSQRWVKEYKGKKETFTVYDDENAIYGHSHEINIVKQGLVHICTTSKNEITLGPNKGRKSNGFSFIIKLEGDNIFEAVGMLEKENPPGLKPELIVWNRDTE